MKENYKDYLFSKHILVAETGTLPFMNSFPMLVTLGQRFGIRVKKNVVFVTKQMIRDAARNLGEYVPELFYRGFPATVRELTPDELLYDQLLHYTHTYGLGWFENPEHSVLENLKKEAIERTIFNEDIPPKDFDIYLEDEATDLLKGYMRELLGSNRPLNPGMQELIYEGWKDFGTDILPESIRCKDTAIFLLYRFKDLSFCRYLKLSDVIKLLRHIQWTQYHSEKLNKLNLRNQDRKLITNVINELIRLDLDPNENLECCDFVECFEKRKIWCGLFHHIHYHPPKECGLMKRFVYDVRNHKNFSVYSAFEKYMREGKYVTAACTLARMKSRSELIRHLNYILSRCKTDAEMKEVFKWLE